MIDFRVGRNHMAASKHQMQYRNYDHNWHQVQSGNWGVLSNRIGVVIVKTFLGGGEREGSGGGDRNGKSIQVFLNL